MGVERNIEIAIDHYQVASNNGVKSATRCLADIYFDESYSKKDLNKALLFYELAKEQGCNGLDDKICYTKKAIDFEISINS